MITGNARFFAAGADLNEMAEKDLAATLNDTRPQLWARLQAFNKPLIAAVNGYALGAGCELALLCDVVVAGENVTWEDGKSERVLYTPEIAENQQMISLLSPFQNKGKAQLEVKIGETNGRLEGDRDKVRFVQTNMGRLILAAQMDRTGIHHSPASRKPFSAGANVTASDLHVYAGCGVNALSGLRMAREL